MHIVVGCCGADALAPSSKEGGRWQVVIGGHAWRDDSGVAVSAFTFCVWLLGARLHAAQTLAAALQEGFCCLPMVGLVRSRMLRGCRLDVVDGDPPARHIELCLCLTGIVRRV